MPVGTVVGFGTVVGSVTASVVGSVTASVVGSVTASVVGSVVNSAVVGCSSVGSLIRPTIIFCTSVESTTVITPSLLRSYSLICFSSNVVIPTTFF